MTFARLLNCANPQQSARQVELSASRWKNSARFAWQKLWSRLDGADEAIKTVAVLGGN